MKAALSKFIDRWLFSFWSRGEDEHNLSSFRIRLGPSEFLNISVADMMTTDLGMEVNFGLDGGRLRLDLPYLAIWIQLWPCIDVHHKTWRTQRFPYGWDLVTSTPKDPGFMATHPFILYGKNGLQVGKFKSKVEAIRFAKAHRNEPRWTDKHGDA